MQGDEPMGIRKRHMKTKFHLKILGATAVLALAGLPSAAPAQIGGSLAVGNTVPVTNALRRNLPGTNGDPDNAGRVEIRQTHTGGTILSPTNDPGQLETFNPLITNSYLGRGVLGSHPGVFSETFEDRSVLALDKTYYARVFDRADPAAAIYYADTAPFARPSDEIGEVNPEFGPLKLVGTGELDGDADGEGIPDAMEGDLGLDPNSADTDEDGYNDWFEAYYSDYLNSKVPDPSLEIQINAPAEPAVDPHTVSWWTIPVPAMTYHLQYRRQWIDGDSYSNVWSGVATETLLDVEVQDWVGTNDPPKGFFRVVVPYDGP